VRREPPEADQKNAKLDPDVHALARRVAGLRGVHLGQAINDALRRELTRECRRLVDRLHAELGENGAG